MKTTYNIVHIDILLLYIVLYTLVFHYMLHIKKIITYSLYNISQYIINWIDIFKKILKNNCNKKITDDIYSIKTQKL